MDNNDKSEDEIVSDDYFDLDMKEVTTCGNTRGAQYSDIFDPEDNFMNPIYVQTVR